jgi:hypothetical protein
MASNSSTALIPISINNIKIIIITSTNSSTSRPEQLCHLLQALLVKLTRAQGAGEAAWKKRCC